MSAELILSIVGIILVLIAASDSFKSSDSSESMVNSKLRTPLGVIGVVMIIYVGYSYSAVNLQGQIEQPELGNQLEIEYPIKNIQVLSPVKDDAVACRILTKGVYPDANDKDIWVLLKPTDNRYYPQSDHTNTSYKRNGEWQVITRFGGDKDEKYEIIVYEADANASEFFSSTIQTWKDNLDYPGLNESDIPSGAKEVDRIAVSLEENCRGVF